MSFDDWLTHFRSNPARQLMIEAGIDWDAPSPLDARTRRAFVRSFQRFELGESGDGERLLAKASAAGDPTYLAALELLVVEEQKHSALFRRGLDHLGAPTLSSHWSDAAFTTLRRALGLRTELALFLIAETVAMGYFVALAEHAPDPVLRGIGRRISTDERDHIRFQIDRLRVGFRRMPGPARVVVGLCWGVIAVGAATVITVDHRAALRACGLSPLDYWGRALRQFRRAAQSVLTRPRARPLGPTTKGS
ncbi:ferritin-like domain-containing protein [Salinibacterium sp. ZJ454]|uniref:ferritin-like domain-containing protein n=1 Tax=Salinibacterium sp. ZJ454 TaxID=2708339 RepID=UPI00141F6034|nr:ferritin-like domain-containing protein [Salinibacterium sp. ZJ454]